MADGQTTAEPEWLYRAADPATLIIVPLDDLVAVYHRASGQTHIVDDAVPVILAAMGNEPCRLGALFDTLSRDYGVEGDIAALATRIDDMCASGLVRRE